MVLHLDLQTPNLLFVLVLCSAIFSSLDVASMASEAPCGSVWHGSGDVSAPVHRDRCPACVKRRATAHQRRYLASASEHCDDSRGTQSGELRGLTRPWAGKHLSLHDALCTARRAVPLHAAARLRLS